jgi:hypothetical protein
MRIRATSLVLNKMTRAGQLSDVVVVAADSGKESIRPDDVAGRLAEIRHGQAMSPGARGLQRQAPQQWATEIGQFQEGEVGSDPGGGLGHWHDHHGQRGTRHRHDGTEQATSDDRSRGPALPQPDCDTGQHACQGQYHDRHIQVPPAPHDSYADRTGYPAHQSEKQRVALTQSPLPIQQDRQNHGCKDPDTAVIEHGDEDGRERNRDQLGTSGQQACKSRCQQNHHREQTGEERHLPQLDIALAAIEHDQHPEGAEDNGVVHQRTGCAPQGQPTGSTPAVLLA